MAGQNFPAFQTSLRQRIACAGIGLHSGRQVAMTLRPAPADTGIVFRRTDLAEPAIIPARWDAACDLMLCTGIANEDGVKVGTVEHLLAALSGCGVDNLYVDLDGPEVPVMDGSSAPFVSLIESVGVAELPALRRYLKVVRPVEVRDGDKLARLEPYDGFAMAVSIDFASAAVGRQAVTVRLDQGGFRDELARARTFGFLHEVEWMRSRGLARGGSLDNAVVIEGDRVLNEGGLRFRDEFARHKALDAVGDLALAGAPLLGRFRGERCGHAINNRLLHALFADTSAWRYITVASRSQAEYQLAVA